MWTRLHQEEVKAAEYEIQKPSTCRATLFPLQVFVDVSRFSPCAINLARNKNICCGLKECSALIGWFAWRGSNMAAFVAWQVVSLMKNEQQRQNLLLKVDQRSTFHNNFFQPATNVFTAGQVDGARWKTGNIDENLQRNDVARQVEGFCISYFAALSEWWTPPGP